MGRMTVKREVVCAVAAVAMSASLGADAKQHDGREDLTIEVVSAIHLPTGCVASVEYDDGVVVKAYLTDPQCLPEGIERRVIPAKGPDFYILTPADASPAVW